MANNIKIILKISNNLSKEGDIIYLGVDFFKLFKTLDPKKLIV